MAGRFGAFAKLSRDDGGGRPTDTWSCARCSQRNSPALKRCENESCRAVRDERRVDPGGVPVRRRADMGFDPNAGTRSRSGAAAWAGPNRAFPRDGGARVDPPRGPSRARVDADAEARSKYAKKATTKKKEAPQAEEAEPVLVETAAPGFENQGVAKTDVVVDEDGDAANDFLLADPDPAERVDLAARKKKNPNPRGGGCFCASCGLDVSGQPDVPLPPLKKEDPPRPETEVGRWLGRCEGGCEVALCGPCATAMTTPALAAATTKLEAVISGLGTGYTELGGDDDPEGADARDPPVRCPRVVLKKGRN